jgi:DNA topoisomerase-1
MPPKPYKKYNKPTKVAGPLSKNGSAKYLIIVESPSKCAKIEHFLGEDYCCIASKGHIRSIEGLKAIDTKNGFVPTFSIIDEKKEHVEAMRKVIAKFSKPNIIVASDDDREGEAIAWHICQLFDLPIETTQRIIFHEVTKNAIIDAVKSPTHLNMNLVHAQHARQVLDIIVGYKISPFLWKYLYNNKSNSLSAGRCQTPALRLVYDNEKENEMKIKNGKENGLEIRHKIKGVFFSRAIEFTLDYEFENDVDVLDFFEKSKNHKHLLRIGEEISSTKSPPKPLHTSRLLQVASNVLHISPKETMSLCQKLYQNGFITYMRTESSHYSSVFLEKAREYIIKEYEKPEYVGKLDAITLKDSSNPHEAIRVTQIDVRFLQNAEDAKMASLYKLIWRTTVESCMAEAKYKNRPIKICAPLSKEYSHIVEIPVFYGWKIVSEKVENERASVQTGLISYFQAMLPGSSCPYQKIYSKVTVRNLHQHYTEASLINKLEDLGIGRPSTFASIVETIQDRGYVKKTDIEGIEIECKEYNLVEKTLTNTINRNRFGNEKNKLVIQPIGKITVDFLLQYFENLFSYEYTKKMEEQLDLVSGQGQEVEWSSICKHCYDEIKRLSGPIKNIVKQSYVVETGYEYIFERFGPAIKHTLEDGSVEYFPAKNEKDIDLEKLKNKEYSLEELLEKKTRCLGKLENQEVYLKNGKYGYYIEWTPAAKEIDDNDCQSNVRRESIKSVLSSKNKMPEEIEISDIEHLLRAEKKSQEKVALRILNSVMSIRKGQFGVYVFYKRPDMKKPQFLNITKFPQGFLTCDVQTLVNWLCETYKLPMPP